MQYIANAREAKEIDGVSIQKIGIPSLVLMERASLKVADVVEKNSKKERDTILVVCSMGNNGGDGVAAARILDERGFKVSILLLGNQEKASEEMKVQLAIAGRLSLSIIQGESIDTFDFLRYSVVIDAIFGIGLSRAITGEYASWIEEINTAKNTVFAVDVPSGIDATTGKVLGTAIKADYTVTFGVNKIGLVLFPGMQYAGKVLVEDIGFPDMAIREVGVQTFSYEREDVASHFPKRIPHSNKGSYGKTLVIAGSAEIGGAAYFAARAAYEMGSGLVKVVTHENNRSMLQERLPEALLSIYTQDDICKNSKVVEIGFWQNFIEDMKWASAIVCGPGLGMSSFSVKLLEMVLAVRKKPVLLDADAINLLAKRSESRLQDGSLTFGSNILLTPHLKEMSRLLDIQIKEIQEDLLATSGVAEKCTLVLKDARTIVASGEKRYINQSGNNALAKGGSGDVLSGMIGGLLARGMEPFEASCLGVYLHGLTAEEYVKEKSSSSMLASDILDMIAKVLP